MTRLAVLLALCAAPALASTSTEQGGVDAAICAYLDPLRIDATLFTTGGDLSPPHLEGIRTHYDGPPVVPGIAPAVAPVPAPWPVSSLLAGLAMLAVVAWKVWR